MRSLAKTYPGSRPVIIEPDESSRAPQNAMFPDLDIERIPTRSHPHQRVGTLEYVVEAARRINELNPAMLVVTSPMVLPVLFKLKRRPARTLYYVLESIEPYTRPEAFLGELLLDLHRASSPLIDLLIFPEENRAAFDLQRGHFAHQDVAVVYNCVNGPDAADDVVPPSQRLPRVLYTGTIQCGQTFAEYYAKREASHLPVDLYGVFGAAEAQAYQRGQLVFSGNVAYKGYVDARRLREERRKYAFSINMWAPTNENQTYAAPNKFFEAIADGVVPITAPHPQCKMLTERYKCGIVMSNWTFDAFRTAVESAIQSLGTSEYQEMVMNCRTAVREEIHWDAQFAKVKRLLPERL